MITENPKTMNTKKLPKNTDPDCIQHYFYGYTFMYIIYCNNSLSNLSIMDLLFIHKYNYISQFGIVQRLTYVWLTAWVPTSWWELIHILKNLNPKFSFVLQSRYDKLFAVTCAPDFPTMSCQKAQVIQHSTKVHAQ